MIAFATSLAFGTDPSLLVYDDKKIREHLKKCFSLGKLSEFPSRAKINRSLSNSTKSICFKVKVICHCRRTSYVLKTKTTDWDVMQCASCSEVFHKRCEKWRLDSSSNQRHLWKCKQCKQNGPEFASQFLSVKEVRESLTSLSTNWIQAYVGLTVFVLSFSASSCKQKVICSYFHFRTMWPSAPP